MVGHQTAVTALLRNAYATICIICIIIGSDRVGLGLGIGSNRRSEPNTVHIRY